MAGGGDHVCSRSKVTPLGHWCRLSETEETRARSEVDESKLKVKPGAGVGTWKAETGGIYCQAVHILHLR